MTWKFFSASERDSNPLTLGCQWNALPTELSKPHETGRVWVWPFMFSECNTQQTMNHLFVSCPDVQIFWQSFSQWWNVQNDVFIVLNDETIMYGFTNGFSQQLGLNLCSIIAKYYIYCASRNGENYYFKAFLAYIKSKLSIEKSKCESQINL